MTREEQIIKASQLYAKHQQKPFMDGALWADQNPVINNDGMEMLYVLNKGHKLGYKDAVNKTINFLWDCGYIDTLAIDEIIDKYKKYMEEQ